MRPFLEFAGFTGTGFIIKPIVTLLTPVLEVLIEAGYDRSLSYGVPAPFRLIPRINPFLLARDVVDAIGEGIHDAFGGGSAPQQAPEQQQAPVSTAAAIEVAESTGPQPADDTDVLEDTETIDESEETDIPEQTEEIEEPAQRARLTEARTSPKTAKSTTRSVRQAA